MDFDEVICHFNLGVHMTAANEFCNIIQIKIKILGRIVDR